MCLRFILINYYILCPKAALMSSCVFNGLISLFQAGNALHPFMLFDPRNISPFLYSSSSQLHPNFLPPHVSSPNPSSASVMRYPPLDAPVLLGPTPSAMSKYFLLVRTVCSTSRFGGKQLF